MSNQLDPITVAFQRGLGPWLFPLSGKLPIQKEWQKRDPVTEEVVREWVELGHNLGIRCGAGSGVFIIDDDRPKHPGDTNLLELPASGFVIRSPTGSEHSYFRHVDGVRNSAGKYLGDHIDVRGEGGYCVFAGSIHPDQPGIYELVSDGEIPDCPQRVIDMLVKRPNPARPPANPEPYTGQTSHYARSAFEREVALVVNAPDGTRNDTLNRAAFNLGQLVGGGELDESEVVSALCSCFPGDSKAEGTVRRGVEAGITSPRRAPVAPSVGRVTLRGSVPEHFREDVLVPGTHAIAGTDSTEYHEQPNDHFCSDVLGSLPDSMLYLRGGAVGEIIDDTFALVDQPRMQSIVDAGVRLVRGRVAKPTEAKPDPVPYLEFHACTGQLAALVIGSARVSGSIRKLVAISPFPVYYGAGFDLARPGWNADCGVFVSAPDVPEPLPIDAARDLLLELVCDFPWVSDADRTNYFGLLLTPILRHAIRGAVPMHLIEAPDVAAGKTLLASGVLGGILLGADIPAGSLGRTEEEREKRILSMLLRGRPIVNFDNISDTLDSEALTKLLTGGAYQGRILGRTEDVEIENRMTVVGTGNNVTHNVDMGRRLVKVRLQTAPAGLCYEHDPIVDWIADNRSALLGALLGLVEHWKAVGAPAGGRYPSFESWGATVGGILGAAGWGDHREGAEALQVSGDTFEGELAAFTALWFERFGVGSVPKDLVMTLAQEHQLFDDCFTGQTEQGHRVWFGRRVLGRLVGRRVSEGVIRKQGKGSATRVWIERNSEGNALPLEG